MTKKDKVLERARARHVPAEESDSTWTLWSRHRALWDDHKKMKRKADYMISLAVVMAERLVEGKPVPEDMVAEFKWARLAYEAAVEVVKLDKAAMHGVADTYGE